MSGGMLNQEASTTLATPTPEQCLVKLREYFIHRYGSANAAFTELDLNGDGIVSIGEFDEILTRLDMRLPVTLPTLFRLVDTKGVGVVSFHKLFFDKDKKRKEPEVQRRSASTFQDFGAASEGTSLWNQRIDDFANAPDAKSFHLDWGHVGLPGAHRLASAIARPGNQRKMDELQLRGNYMGSEGLRILSNVISDFCILRRLDMSWNGIDDFGVEKLTCSSMMPNLKVLNLSHNRIRDPAAEMIARSLARKPNAFEQVHLQSNYIGRFGSIELRYIERHNKKLTVYLENNNANIDLDQIEESRLKHGPLVCADDLHFTFGWQGDAKAMGHRPQAVDYPKPIYPGGPTVAEARAKRSMRPSVRPSSRPGSRPGSTSDPSLARLPRRSSSRGASFAVDAAQRVR